MKTKKFNSVLVVDDDETNNFITESVLRKLGVATHIYCKTSGRQALDFLRANAENETGRYPELILLDLNMPEVNGFQFLEELSRTRHRNGKNTRIIVVTSSESERDACMAATYHIDGYFMKPFTLEKLRQLMVSLHVIDYNTPA